MERKADSLEEKKKKQHLINYPQLSKKFRYDIDYTYNEKE